jgi:hypothetical protein
MKQPSVPGWPPKCAPPAPPKRRRSAATPNASATILAEAQRDAETTRGDGDARASQIYAQSFGKNPEFYRFYRSMEAYKATFKGKSDILVLDSNSEFFKYFKGRAQGNDGGGHGGHGLPTLRIACEPWGRHRIPTSPAGPFVGAIPSLPATLLSIPAVFG